MFVLTKKNGEPLFLGPTVSKYKEYEVSYAKTEKKNLPTCKCVFIRGHKSIAFFFKNLLIHKINKLFILDT